MTENEAIERCDLLVNSLSVDNGVTNAFCDRSKGYVTFEKMREFTQSCKKALEEVQQYRQIGTVEECHEAVEKKTAKKPEFVDTRFMNNGKHISDGCQLQKCYKCPNCNQHIFHVWDDELYCKYCGQLLDWSDDDGKTD